VFRADSQVCTLAPMAGSPTESLCEECSLLGLAYELTASCLPAVRKTTYGGPPNTRVVSAHCTAQRGTDPTAMRWTSRRTHTRSASARTPTRSFRPAARSWSRSLAERTGHIAVMPDRFMTCQLRSAACCAFHTHAGSSERAYTESSELAAVTVQIQQGLIFLLGCPACAHNFRYVLCPR